jgi:diguanylate cyclase (GGDEF)-like protein
LHGSQLLRELGEVILTELRNEYIGTRYGGDEFVLMLPGANKKIAKEFAERLKKRINESVFLTGEGLSVRITASFGLATFPEDASTKDELVRLADQAMYRVKETTRNAIATA